MITSQSIAEFLNQYFDTESFPDEKYGLFQAANRPIKRMGMALEPWPELTAWVTAEQLDAVLLHRPFRLLSNALPAEVGLLVYHLPLEEKLALGFNTRLADALGFFDLTVLGERAGRPLGMIGSVTRQTITDFSHSVRDIFGGLEDALLCEGNEVRRVAVVGAMTPQLIEQAAARCADVYITGQFRQPARQILLETGMSLIVVGHRRSEEWALRTLSHVLTERFADLTVVLPPNGPD